MLVRDFACAVCGAPRRTSERALVVLCIHCGAILTLAGDGYRLEPDIERLVRPSAAQARLTALVVEMTEATNDRERWRLLCEEQVIVMALAYPEHTVPLPTDPQARARHVRDAVAMSELATFDPEVRRRLGVYSDATMKLTLGDPVAAARAMLVAARAYHDSMGVREGADHLAREMVRGAVAGYASLLGVGAIERIRTEVLGDTEGARSCPKCGGPLSGDGLVRCRHCEAVTSVTVDDAWTTAQLGIWKIARADLVRRGELDGPAPVIAAVGGFLWTSAKTVPPASAARFLRLAIGWLTAADLGSGLDVLCHAVNDEQRRLLDGIRAELAHWTPDASLRPAPHVPVTEFPAPTPADEAAWIESALALDRMRRGPLVELLGQCLSAMQVAAVHEVAVGLSPRAALEFFERARPGYDRAAMLAELRRLMPGYDMPRVRAFTTELAHLLSQSV